jgi:hypothetical protein
MNDILKYGLCQEKYTDHIHSANWRAKANFSSLLIPTNKLGCLKPPRR